MGSPATTRPNPAAVRASALELPWRGSLAYGSLLGAVAVAAPAWVGGDLRAAILPGVPAAIVLMLFLLGRRAERRRVTMALATSTAGFLALASVSSLGAIDRLSSEDPAIRGGVQFQLLCLGLSAVFLASTVPAWRRVNEEGAAADDELRMYEEL